MINKSLINAIKLPGNFVVSKPFWENAVKAELKAFPPLNFHRSFLLCLTVPKDVLGDVL